MFPHVTYKYNMYKIDKYNKNKIDRLFPLN